MKQLVPRTSRLVAAGTTTLTLFFLSVVQAAAFVNPVIGILGTDKENAQSGATVTGYGILLWNAVIIAGGLVVLLYFIWGAMEWLLSAGEASKLQSARNRMIHSVIGIMILASVIAVFMFVQYVMGVEFINFTTTSTGGSPCIPTETNTCPTGNR